MDEEMMKKLAILKAIQENENDPDVFVSSIDEADTFAIRHLKLSDAKVRRQLVEFVIDEDNHVWGSSDEYWNLLMRFFSVRDFYSVIQICDAALQIYPRNADLLACMIRACGACGNYELGAEWLEKAEELERRWWSSRLFMYTIVFLQEKLKNHVGNSDETLQQGLDMANDYIRYFPYDEHGYNQRAELLIIANRREEAILDLQNSINDVQPDPNDRRSSLVTAQCCVTLLNLLDDSNDYALIIDIANKGLLNTTQEQPSSSIGFFMYRKALALDAIAVLDNFSNPNKIREALLAYQSAYDLNQDREYARTIERRYAILYAHADAKDNIGRLVRRPLYISEAGAEEE